MNRKPRTRPLEKSRAITRSFQNKLFDYFLLSSMIPIIIIMNIIKKIFIEFDLFSALPTLRARGETDIMSIFGGILSFLLIGTFTFVFVQRTVNVLEYRAIEVTER